MMINSDLTGQMFGRLTVVERAGHYVSPNKKQTHALWRCVCDCGNTTLVRAGMLKNGQVQSCGCLQKDRVREANTKHNERWTPLYNIWRAMKERCNNPHSISYKWYGGKGIKVCDEWINDYNAFREWAKANGYSEGLSIDRINPDLGYCPENCRWLTRAENASIAAKEMQRRRKCIKT